MPLLLSSWPEWVRPYWLLCLPIAGLLLWALYRAQHTQDDWRSWLPEAFHAILLKEHTTRKNYRRYWLIAAAWLCALLALMGPSWDKTVQQPTLGRYFSPLVIVIQLTPDMLANDLVPSRLEHVREKVTRLLEERDASFTGLVVYAGSAHTVVPLSNDLLTSQNLLQALEPDLMPTPGERADLAVQRAINLLQRGAQGEGQILLMSTGVSVLEQAAIEKHLKRQPIQLKIMGVGTTDGAPIVQSAQGHLLTDASGAIIISRLNETSLQLLAKHTNSPYAQLSDDSSDLLALDMFTQTSNNLTTEIAGRSMDNYDQGYWFILPLLLIVAGFARRGAVLVLLVCLLPLQPAFAFDLDNLWLRPDQHGEKLLEEQPALAAERFTDLQWRASALYLAEDYQAAAELFSQIDSATAHYNRGNALALSGSLAHALEAYQQALDHDPEMLAAQYNFAVVEEHLQTSQTNAIDKQTTQSDQKSAASSSSIATVTATAPTVAVEPTEQDEVLPETHTTDTEQTDSTHSISEQSKPPADTATQHAQAQPTEQPVQLESWLEQIPDNPSELLKRKFWYEQSMQESTP